MAATEAFPRLHSCATQGQDSMNCHGDNKSEPISERCRRLLNSTSTHSVAFNLSSAGGERQCLVNTASARPGPCYCATTRARDTGYVPMAGQEISPQNPHAVCFRALPFALSPVAGRPRRGKDRLWTPSCHVSARPDGCNPLSSIAKEVPADSVCAPETRARHP